MRQNLPVTQQQKPIPENYRLVSRTDIDGTIVEANDEFIEISGYTESELIGQPHNLLRHPDVPPAVFKDMWQTLQSGEGWTQIVKNRAKNGDHYWVKANVAPVKKQDQISGYISVRMPATESEIALATTAYPLIQKGNLIIKKGQVFTPFHAKLDKLNPFKKWSLLAKLSLGNALLLGLAVWLAAWMRSSGLDQLTQTETPGLVADQLITQFGWLSMFLLVILSAYFAIMNYVFVSRPLRSLQKIMQCSQRTGDLSVRAVIKNQDEIGQLARTYNQQMQNMQVAIGETGRMLSAIAHGKLNASTSIPMKGDFDLLKNSTNLATQAMRQTTEEIYWANCSKSVAKKT